MLARSQDTDIKMNQIAEDKKKKRFQPATSSVSLAKGRSIGSNASPCLLQGGGASP